MVVNQPLGRPWITNRREKTPSHPTGPHSALDLAAVAPGAVPLGVAERHNRRANLTGVFRSEAHSCPWLLAASVDDRQSRPRQGDITDSQTQNELVIVQRVLRSQGRRRKVLLCCVSLKPLRSANVQSAETP